MWRAWKCSRLVSSMNETAFTLQQLKWNDVWKMRRKILFHFCYSEDWYKDDDKKPWKVFDIYTMSRIGILISS